MPFKSEAQARFMFSQHPKIAKKWARETKSIKKLPEYKKPKHKMMGMGMCSNLKLNAINYKNKTMMNCPGMGMGKLVHTLILKDALENQ